MPYFRDTGYTQAFRAMFDRKPPYTLHNLRQSLEAEMRRLDDAHAAGFAARTRTGVSPRERMIAHPALGGPAPHPEADTGRVFSTAS